MTLPHLPSMAAPPALHEFLLLGIATTHADLDVPRGGVALHLVHQHPRRFAEELLLDLHCTTVRISHPMRIRPAHIPRTVRLFLQVFDVLCMGWSAADGRGWL